MNINSTEHLIETIVLKDGTEITVNDYCKDDETFETHYYAYYYRYWDTIAYVRVNHHTVRKGNKARTKDGRWVEIKKHNQKMSIGIFRRDEDGHYTDRDVEFSSSELANAMFRKCKSSSTDYLNGNVATFSFGGSNTASYSLKLIFGKVRWAY